jgi:hypothetical protein
MRYHQSFIPSRGARFMTDPLDKATSTAPPTLGEGCLSRYDPEALTADNGADFSAAAELWRTTRLQQDLAVQPPSTIKPD